MNDIGYRYRIAAAGKSDSSFIHHDIAELTHHFSVPLKITGRTADVTGIKADPVRTFAFFDGDERL